MERYSDYVIEDFVLDSHFQQWVRFNKREERIFWEKFISSNPDRKDYVLRAKSLLQSIYEQYDTDISDEEISTEINLLVDRIRSERNSANLEEQRSSRLYPQPKVIWWAASIVCLVLIGFLIWVKPVSLDKVETNSYQSFSENKHIQILKNTSSESQTHILEDGSTVILEPGATLSIPSDFPHISRDIYLMGTAQFDVKKDLERPFTVFSNKLVTKVLGTRFTIRAPKDGENVVEVAEGKVSVFKSTDYANPKNEKIGMIVTSNQKIILQTKEDRLVKELLDLPQIVAPLPPTVTFNYENTPVKTVLEELMEAYLVDIIFDEEQLSGCTLSATLSNQTLHEKLAAICEAIEARYELIDGRIMIYGKRC